MPNGEFKGRPNWFDSNNNFFGAGIAKAGERLKRRIDEHRQQFMISEEDIAQMLEELRKTLGTSQAQATTETQELAAREGLPAATQSAMQRGTAIDFGELFRKGAFDIQQFAKGTNIDAAKFLAQLNLRRELAKMQQEAQEKEFWAQMFGSTIGSVGQALPFIL